MPFGGIVWATPVALVAHTVGDAAAEAVNKSGLTALSRCRGYGNPVSRVLLLEEALARKGRILIARLVCHEIGLPQCFSNNISCRRRPRALPWPNPGNRRFRKGVGHLARRTVLVCDNCGKEVGENKGASLRVTFTDARRGSKVADLCDDCAGDMPGRAAARRGRRPKSTAPA
jgi:hypothetical protein